MEKRYACSICGKVCTSRQALGGHTAKEHPGQGKSCKKEKKPKRKYTRRKAVAEMTIRFCPCCGFHIGGIANG